MGRHRLGLGAYLSLEVAALADRIALNVGLIRVLAELTDEATGLSLAVSWAVSLFLPPRSRAFWHDTGSRFVQDSLGHILRV